MVCAFLRVFLCHCCFDPRKRCLHLFSFLLLHYPRFSVVWPYRPIDAAPVRNSAYPLAKLVLCPLARVCIVGLSQRVDSFGAIEAQTQAIDADEDEDANRNERVPECVSDKSNPVGQSGQLAAAATHGSAHEDEVRELTRQ
jgi:hypothetical protein